jgi:uncharacterized protein
VAEIVVADAGPLIAFQQIAHLDLLRTLFGTVLIPETVAHEVEPTLPNLPGWIVVRPTATLPRQMIPRGRLDDGEYEAILLAHALSAALVVVDDRDARRALRRLGLPIVGTVGVLLRAKDAGRVSAIEPLLRRLRSYDFFISAALYQEVLALAGESDADPTS